MASIINLKDNLIDRNHSLRIGEVCSVSSSEIKALLDKETPHSVALNTGTIVNFPRINSYVLIPNERGAIACMVTWIGMEEDRNTKKDWDSLNLPTIKTKMSLMPLATIKPQRLTNTSSEDANKEVKTIRYSMERGVTSLPSVGDAVILPTKEQLKSIVTAASEEDQRVEIGTSPYADDAEITVDPNKLFGRNLAVLGSTGSGKSCSIAGLIRWSIQAAHNKMQPHSPYATFIIFDYHGEYAKAFQDKDLPIDLTILGDPASSPKNTEMKQLFVPLKLWSLEHWKNFAEPSTGMQLPALIDAIAKIKAEVKVQEKDQVVPGDFTLHQVIEKIKSSIGKNTFKQDNISPMLGRLESYNIPENQQLKAIIEKNNSNSQCDKLWNPKYLRDVSDNTNTKIVIVDLSYISEIIIHIVISVMLQEILDAHKENRNNFARGTEAKELQTILVLEEAHVFIAQSLDNNNDFSVSRACLSSCSSIAREGRKFGLNLVVSSQMPHEVSTKVISQCSTFLLHRITGYKDRDYVNKLIPDRFGELLHELPNLNSKQAYLLGWVTEIPKLVEMKNLDPDQRPKSDDPKIWEHWIGEK